MKSYRKILVIALLSYIAAAGCASTAQQRARTALDIAAFGMQQTYRVTSSAYQTKSEETVRQVAAAHGTYTDYLNAMRPLTITLGALDVATDVLQEASTLLQSYSSDPVFATRWRTVVRELLATMRVVVDDLRTCGVPVPDAVTQGINIVDSLLTSVVPS